MPPNLAFVEEYPFTPKEDVSHRKEMDYLKTTFAKMLGEGETGNDKWMAMKGLLGPRAMLVWVEGSPATFDLTDRELLLAANNGIPYEEMTPETVRRVRTDIDLAVESKVASLLRDTSSRSHQLRGSTFISDPDEAIRRAESVWKKFVQATGDEVLAKSLLAAFNASVVELGDKVVGTLLEELAGEAADIRRKAIHLLGEHRKAQTKVKVPVAPVKPSSGQ